MSDKITRELEVKIMFEASRHNDLLFAEAYERLIEHSKQKTMLNKFNSSATIRPISYQKPEVKK